VEIELLTAWINHCIKFDFEKIKQQLAPANGYSEKLLLIITYLRSPLAKEKIWNLAILSIENDIAHSIPKDHLIVKFTSVKTMDWFQSRSM
jgi:hypothetical protein